MRCVRLYERLIAGLVVLLLFAALMAGATSGGVAAQDATPTAEPSTGSGVRPAARRPPAISPPPSNSSPTNTRPSPCSGRRPPPATRTAKATSRHRSISSSTIPTSCSRPKATAPRVTMSSSQQGFTPQDLVTAGPNTYFDFPGNPRDPGCTYENYFKQKVDEYGLEPTTYVRFVTDEAAGKLYVEYWFWYLFNDWNNTHETDWEMVYVTFNTTSVEEALTMNPERVGYAQHGGGEFANWGDDKIELDGTRLVVYPAAGSHATYFSEATWIGWGENGTGFGCDNTTAPLNETPLNAVVIPDVIDPDGPFAWALYEGHWGQREIAVFNGPLVRTWAGNGTIPPPLSATGAPPR